MRKTICNMCGREFDLFDRQENFYLYSYKIGYGSRHDGCRMTMDLCIDCVDKLIDACAISPLCEADDISDTMPF